MAKPTLVYFDLPGLGELPRLIYSLAQAEFEDRRIQFGEWKEMKKNRAPTGWAPWLELEDGTKISESPAVYFYVAATTGLLPGDIKEQAKALQIVVFYNNFERVYADCFHTPEGPAREEKLKHAQETKFPDLTAAFEKFLGTVQTSPQFACGDRLTAADVAVYAVRNLLLGENYCKRPYVDDKFEQNYPIITRIFRNVAQQPGIKAYREKRGLPAQ